MRLCARNAFFRARMQRTTPLPLKRACPKTCVASRCDREHPPVSDVRLRTVTGMPCFPETVDLIDRFGLPRAVPAHIKPFTPQARSRRDTSSPGNPPTSCSPSREPSLPTCCMHANTAEHRMRRHATRNVQPAPGSLSKRADLSTGAIRGPSAKPPLPIPSSACQQINVAPSLNLPVSFTCPFQTRRHPADGNRVPLFALPARA